jgi:hypothetical protein
MPTTLVASNPWNPSRMPGHFDSTICRTCPTETPPCSLPQGSRQSLWVLSGPVPASLAWETSQSVAVSLVRGFSRGFLVDSQDYFSEVGVGLHVFMGLGNFFERKRPVNYRLHASGGEMGQHMTPELGSYL